MAAHISRSGDSRYERWLHLVRETGWQMCAEGNVRVKLLALTESELRNERDATSAAGNVGEETQRTAKSDSAVSGLAGIAAIAE